MFTTFTCLFPQVLVWGELSNYIITQLDLTKLEPDEDSMFPIFDLCAVDAHETPLTRAIRHKSDIVTGEYAG